MVDKLKLIGVSETTKNDLDNLKIYDSVSYEDVISHRIIKKLKITLSDGKVTEGFFWNFTNSDKSPALNILHPEKESNEIIPFSIVKKIEELKNGK